MRLEHEASALAWKEYVPGPGGSGSAAETPTAGGVGGSVRLRVRWYADGYRDTHRCPACGDEHSVTATFADR